MENNPNQQKTLIPDDTVNGESAVSDSMSNTQKAPKAAEQTTEPREHRFRVADYSALLKPRVMSLVVFTGLVGIMMAPGEIPVGQSLVAVLCIAIAAGASGAINMWYDSDIDRLMARTQRRPIPAGHMKPINALIFGIILSVGSVWCMYSMVNDAAALLLALTIFYYVFIYTMWLKRRTPQNIVIGGASGALPPMIGWAAVTGDVALGSIILFMIIFLWTPPHTWALALFRNEDYTKANVPMLPVVAGVHETKKQIILYTVLLIPFTMAPLFIGMVGPLYGIVAAGFNVGLAHKVWKLWKCEGDKEAKPLFLFSILYLFSIYLMFIVDKLVMHLI